jgi:hypothetical protein
MTGQNTLGDGAMPRARQVAHRAGGTAIGVLAAQ